MTTEEKILSYLLDHGLDLTQYIDTFRHVIPGTVCFSGRSMWGIQTSGKYEHWIKLMEILKTPGCPLRMEHVESSWHERPGSFERLIWEGESE